MVTSVVFVLLVSVVFTPFIENVMRGAMASLTRIHNKCRSVTPVLYPDSHINRFPVLDNKVNWLETYEGYDPPAYTSDSLTGKPWADPEIGTPGFDPKWHNIDGTISRVSYENDYEIKNGFPLNPIGRTGIEGRGKLGRWGPNHAADPLVTRWKRDSNGKTIKNSTSSRPILQFVAIKRRDNGQWALPGGMVDPGENVSLTAIREFKEEATNELEMSNDDKVHFDRDLETFFSGGKEVASSYVDDPRNTDNAWMETRVYSFHDDEGKIVGRIPLNAGDDAVGVRWVDIDKNIQLYASHSDFVSKIAELLGAHW